MLGGVSNIQSNPIISARVNRILATGYSSRASQTTYSKMPMKLNLSKTRLTVPDYNSLLYFKLCVMCKWEHFKMTLVGLHKGGNGLYLPRNGEKLAVLILLRSDGPFHLPEVQGW